jgi:lysophospholipid acyltransferase (LPLAT)-like uncharacterized protein
VSLPFKERFVTLLIGFILNMVIRFIGFTSKIVSEKGKENLKPFEKNQAPVIFAMWHNRPFYLMYYHVNTLRNKLQIPQVVLVSESRDGQFIANNLKMWGVKSVRGSSTRGAKKALKEMFGFLRKKVSVVVTPDGPLGPAYEFKLGVLGLSQLSSAPIVPITWYADKYWALGTWDKFMIPKPFSRIAVQIGEPIYIDKKIKDEALLEEKRLEVQKKMMDLIEAAKAEVRSFS